MNAATIARALKGRRVGFQWIARCPAHDDRDPSLSLKDADNGKVLVHCHAGCTQAQVIDELRALGLWGPSSHVRCDEFDRRPRAPQFSRAQDFAEHTAIARQLWQSAVPSLGTVVERYLRSRAISVAIPTVIRFHPQLKHPTGSRWPGMVALVTCGIDGTPVAIHRTFLARDGDRKAPVSPPRLMLGPCHGGVVRLAVAETHLMVGEGIETCFAAMQATGLPTWAALSTAGLRALELPMALRDIIVLADGDAPGEAAAKNCARRWRSEGRRVRIARPPPGMDFNDILMGHSRCVEKAPR